jgi:hypothetical protein
VLGRSLKLVTLYVAGLLVVGGWSLSHVLGGTVDSENAAGVIVFPLAWTFGFWPTVLPLLLAWKVWRLQTVLGEWCERRAAGVSTAAQEQELEDTLTLLAMEENHVPERFARPLIRRALGAARSSGA